MSDPYERYSPNEIRRRALEYDDSDIREAEEKSDRFRKAIDDPIFWRMKIEKKFPNCNLHHPGKINYKEIYDGLRSYNFDMDTPVVMYRGKLNQRCQDLNEAIAEKTKQIHELIFDLDDLKERRKRREERYKSEIQDEIRKEEDDLKKRQEERRHRQKKDKHH